MSSRNWWTMRTCVKSVFSLVQPLSGIALRICTSCGSGYLFSLPVYLSSLTGCTFLRRYIILNFQSKRGFSCLLASPYLWCRRHFYGSQFLHWGSPSSSHPRERTVPQADFNKVWLTLVTYWSNNAHFQCNVIFPWPQIFLSRIPVSNVHVVLGCYGNSSFTSTGNLKALGKFTLTASCRKVSFILHHPDEDGMSQEGRLAHIRKDAEVEREKCEHNSGWTKGTRFSKPYDEI